MGKLSTAIAFLTGAAVGGAAVWYITKEWYARLTEEEINSVKEAYALYSHKQEKADEALLRYRGTEEKAPEASKISVTTAKVAEKGSIAEYAKRVQNGAPLEYSKTVIPPKIEVTVESTPPESSGNIPYVISPEEFDELEGYTPISLTYFADGVLADDVGIIIDDAEEIVGDGLSRFGEYAEDAVYVRNDAKRCDYEILLDEREYAEFRKTLPANI